MILEYKGKTPETEKAAFIAENATLIGDVHLGEGSSVWFGAVLRGDGARIEIGERTNVQDNTVVHVDEGCSCRIGSEVTIGHGCIIHGCTIEDNCLIGMGAIIMNNAKIGKNSLVGAGALVTEGKEFPEGSLIMGSPAKVKSPASEETLKTIRESAQVYIDEAEVYANIK